MSNTTILCQRLVGAVWMVLICACAIQATYAEEEKDAAVLYGYDALTRPAEPVELKARVIYPSGVKGSSKHADDVVSFLCGNRVIASATVGSDGAASAVYVAGREGEIEIELKLNSERRVAPDSKLRVYVRRSGTRFLITDIDGTVSSASLTELLLLENGKIKPTPGSVRALRSLSSEYTIVYLSGREEVLMNKTREWLEMNGFPAGPILLWSMIDSPLSYERYKTETIARLRARWPGIAVGVGNMPADARAYIDNGLQAFLIGTSAAAPTGAECVSGWAEIERRLSREGR